MKHVNISLPNKAKTTITSLTNITTISLCMPESHYIFIIIKTNVLRDYNYWAKREVYESPEDLCPGAYEVCQ